MKNLSLIILMGITISFKTYCQQSVYSQYKYNSEIMSYILEETIKKDFYEFAIVVNQKNSNGYTIGIKYPFSVKYNVLGGTLGVEIKDFDKSCTITYTLSEIAGKKLLLKVMDAVQANLQSTKYKSYIQAKVESNSSIANNQPNKNQPVNNNNNQVSPNNQSVNETTTSNPNQQVNQTITKEKRLALVIGNSNYGGGLALKNPVNDANLMTQTLQSLGFDVIKQNDANKRVMENAIREFSKKLPDYNVALFYYAGHGLQVDGVNYLIPTDATLNEKTDCKYEAVPVSFAVEEFEKYPNNINIVILDACRNNPFRSWARGGERGFRAIQPASGTIISFATSEGSTASDGSGKNGLFTEELVKQMVIPQPLESVFKKTRVQVQKQSNGGQNPQEWSQLTGDFYFNK